MFRDQACSMLHGKKQPMKSIVCKLSKKKISHHPQDFVAYQHLKIVQMDSKILLKTLFLKKETRNELSDALLREEESET